MKLDKIDYKILWNLDYNARMPMSELASKVGLSKQNMNYRINRLVREKVILGFLGVVDAHSIGYLTYRIYFRYRNVNQEKEKEIIDYFVRHNHVIWAVSLSGSWDLEVVLFAKNNIHLNNMLKKIREDIGKNVSKYDVSASIFNYHFKHDYLVSTKREQFTPFYYGKEPKTEVLDELDLKILSQISVNCRQSNKEMGDRFGVSYHTVKQRIANLEEKKVIHAYRTLIDLDKIGRKFYKAAIYLNNPTKEEEKRIYSFCSQFNFVVYLVEVLGSWHFEIETEVADEEQFVSMMKSIRQEFPDLVLDYNILHVTKQHRVDYLPMRDDLVKASKEMKIS